MKANELMTRLAAYGADMEGIRDRFLDDPPFYAECFEKFLADNCFPTLVQSLSEQDYSAAFAAAHSLNGLAGNMGLTPLHAAAKELLEALRAGNTAHLDAQLARVVAEQATLVQLCEAVRAM